VLTDDVTRSLPPRPAPTRSHRRWLILAIALAAVATAVAAGAAYVAWENQDRAEGWEKRAFRLERNFEQLNGLLVERSTQLNERTSELNTLAATVTRQQNALVESESDVESLSERQRQLAAEKAAVEDERAALAVQSGALEDVASALVQCNSGLVQLFNYVVDGDRGSAGAIVGGVSADCAVAESGFDDYQARYG
jgi:septal ring factor EnvC (AmiA/AmiB activator)